MPFANEGQCANDVLDAVFRHEPPRTEEDPLPGETAGISPYMWAIPLGIAAVIILWVILKKKSFGGKDSKLKNYIESNLKKGYTRQQITVALLKNNYSVREINEAFRKIK